VQCPLTHRAIARHLAPGGVGVPIGRRLVSAAC